jgi:type VI secretion system protein ImpH
MADKDGRTDSDLIDAVLNETCTLDFFRLIRRLELAVSGTSKIGRDGPSVNEAVRIRPDASFRFPPGAIAKIEESTDSKFPLVMTITFFGLYGRNGTLPWHYTSRIIHQIRPSISDIRYHGSGLREFLDILNHRFTSFFYRAGIKYRWPLVFRQNGEDEATGNLIAFTGLKTLYTHNRLCIPDTALLRYAGLFTIPNSASSLTSLLSDFLDTKVKISQFEGEWLEIDESDRNRIGSRRGNNRLGQSFTIGRRIYSRQHKFRIVIGPICYDQFTELLPGTKKFRELTMLVRMRSGITLKTDYAIKVDRQTVPQVALGRENSRLGRTFFLLSRKKQGPVSCPIFKSETNTLHPETIEMEGGQAQGRLEYV